MQTAVLDELVRVRMSTIPLPDKPIYDPQPEAEELLRYSQLKRKVDSSVKQWEHKKWSMNYHWEMVCQKVQAENHLAEVLAELEIDTLDIESVERYKAAHLNDLTKPKHTGRFAWLLNGIEPTPEYVWRRVNMERYGLPIPPFTANKAAQIKKRLPKAVFWVEECVERNIVRIGDPLLIVNYNGELFISGKTPHSSTYQHLEHVERYIEVWGEPKSEATL